MEQEKEVKVNEDKEELTATEDTELPEIRAMPKTSKKYLWM